MNSTTVGSAQWGHWSDSLTPAMANLSLHSQFCTPTCFYTKFPALGVRLALKTSRKDLGVLNVTCEFLFGPSAKHPADAGQRVRLTARVQNSNSTTDGGWIGMGEGFDRYGPASGMPAWRVRSSADVQGGHGVIGLMLGRDGQQAPTVRSFAEYNRQVYYPAIDALP
eukprot:SAG11_NODE_6567_length_1287_cov_1.416667_3_plen_166_part_01